MRPVRPASPSGAGLALLAVLIATSTGCYRTRLTVWHDATATGPGVMCQRLDLVEIHEKKVDHTRSFNNPGYEYSYWKRTGTKRRSTREIQVRLDDMDVRTAPFSSCSDGPSPGWLKSNPLTWLHQPSTRLTIIDDRYRLTIDRDGSRLVIANRREKTEHVLERRFGQRASHVVGTPLVLFDDTEYPQRAYTWVNIETGAWARLPLTTGLVRHGPNQVLASYTSQDDHSHQIMLVELPTLDTKVLPLTHRSFDEIASIDPDTVVVSGGVGTTWRMCKIRIADRHVRCAELEVE